MTTDLWHPKGIDDLEPAAWSALKCHDNCCVVAGPGSGKTEFLAQKVAFLLENKICAEPRRILAISFKKDAAENLTKRVRERCSEKDARRFDSATFDAFTKGLVDRFRLTLPKQFRPKENYDIVNFKDQQYRGFLNDMRDSNSNVALKIEAIQTGVFQHHLLGTFKMQPEEPKDLHGYLCYHWFLSALRGNIDFLAINRLAEFILRTNSRIGKALAMTYKYVLVDEFQDTTYAQYDFLRTLLGKLQAEVTVVGDNKQRIMAWAGAKPDAFDQFIQDFAAKQFELQMNFRSSPELVRIHHTLARSLEPACKPAKSGVPAKVDRDVAEIWTFSRGNTEYRFLAEWIKNDMKQRNLAPSDYALLVRQKPDETHASLSAEFLNHGLVVCNEAQRFGKLSLQDIVSDELFVFLACLIRVCIQTGAASSWAHASLCVDYFFPSDHEEVNPKRRNLLDNLIQRELRPLFDSFADVEKRIDNCLKRIVSRIGEETIRGAFPQHYLTQNFHMFVEALREYLVFCAASSTSWSEFMDRVDRVGQVSLLTVHKSKGLEYDTVVFMGLDDSAWWSYSSANPEGKATFFVGLSRAKQRVLFTYAGGGRNKISELYQLLSAAGVPERVIN